MNFSTVGDTFQGAYTLDRVIWRGYLNGQTLTFTDGSGGSTLFSYTATSNDSGSGYESTTFTSANATKGVYCSVIGGGRANIYHRPPTTLVESIRATTTGSKYTGVITVNNVSWQASSDGGTCVITDGSGGSTLVTLPSSGTSKKDVEYIHSTQFTSATGLYISTLGSGVVTITPEAGGGERGWGLKREKWKECYYCGRMFPRSELTKQPVTNFWVCQTDLDEQDTDLWTYKYKFGREGRRRDEFN